MLLQVKDMDHVDFIEEETYAESSCTMSWGKDRIDQTSFFPLDCHYEPTHCEAADIYILDTGQLPYLAIINTF